MAFAMGMVFLANLLWYACKSELKARGHPISLWNHFDVFPSMHRLIREETDPHLKLKYKSLLYSLYGAICFSVLGVFLL